MRRTRTILPEIQKGIPLPKLRYHAGNSGARRSPWHKFLLGLEPNDSFLIEKHEAQAVLINAKNANVLITWRTEGSGFRVWRVPPEALPEKPKRLWKHGAARPVDPPPCGEYGLSVEDVSLL